MALRMLQAHVTPESRDDAQAILHEAGHETWIETGGRYGAVVCAVIGAGRTGEVMDELHERLSTRGNLLVLVQPLEGVLPRPLATTANDERENARRLPR